MSTPNQATAQVCSAQDHAEFKTDPEGYGLVSIGVNALGRWFDCPDCASTLFIEAPACARCDDSGYIKNPGALHICHCAAGRSIVANVKEVY